MKNRLLIKGILSCIILVTFIILIFMAYYSSFDILIVKSVSQDSKNVIIKEIECTNNVECFFDYVNKSIVINNNQDNVIDDFEIKLYVENKIRSNISIYLNLFSNKEISLESENVFEIGAMEEKKNTYKFMVKDKGQFLLTLFYTIEYMPDNSDINIYTDYMMQNKINCNDDGSLYSYICKLAKNNNNDNEDGFYTYKENDKDIIYYKGESANNNVLLGNYCFKIMRTTDTGGIKLLYNGIFDKVNGCDNFDNLNFIGFSPFNLMENTNDDMRYMVGRNDSTIKNYVDKWYEENIKDTDVENLLDYDAVFCNDFTLSSSNITLITSPNVKDIYSSFARVSELSRVFVPSLDCRIEDSYSVNRGNKMLKYPIGLISADEAFMGQTTNTSYVNAFNSYWTMSPFYSAHIKNFNRNYMAFVTAGGRLNYVTSTDSLGIRPAVVVRSDVKIIKGNGTMLRPFSIE